MLKNTDNILNIDDDLNICRYCFMTEPKQYLINICKCKTLVHVDCIVEWINIKNKNKCEICDSMFKLNNQSYGIFEKNKRPILDTRIFFPYSDIYPVHFLQINKLKKFTGINRLEMAICYLQTERVKELLKEKEILDKLSEYYYGIVEYKQTPIISLCKGNINGYDIFYGDNCNKYYKILVALIKTGKINLEKRDIFRKTALNYAEENGIAMYYHLACNGDDNLRLPITAKINL